ncbi:MAG: PilZ domain-containing protein [Proteobacteria bacterium]|nr:PilZ domain-containing protein [Pseudomonadota bacterium]
MIKLVPVEDKRRAAKRINFMLRATLQREGEQVLPGRVRDLSPDGMKVELDAAPLRPFALGNMVIAELRGIGRVEAQIVWRRAHWYGVRFSHPVDPERAIRPVGKGGTTPDHTKGLVVRDRVLKKQG